MKKRDFLIGILVGAFLFGGFTAVASEIIAVLSKQPIYVDGQKIEMTAYLINGNNYVRLRDIGKAVDFGVTYNPDTDSVHIDSNNPYVEETQAQTPPTFTDGVPQWIINFELETPYNAVLPFITEVKGKPTDAEKVNAIIVYVRARMTYGTPINNDDTSYQYRMFTEGTPINPVMGLCQDYAMATNFLLRLVNIPSIMTMGDNHAWLTVYIDGGWYYVDSTNMETFFEMDRENLPFADANSAETKSIMEQLVPNNTK